MTKNIEIWLWMFVGGIAFGFFMKYAIMIFALGFYAIWGTATYLKIKNQLRNKKDV